MHREPRNATIEKIVVHTNSGVVTEPGGGAQALARFLENIDGGYHKVTDDHNIVTTAQDDEIVWGASGANTHGLHVCIYGGADQVDEQWHDPYSTATIFNTAVAVSTWCHAHQIPVVKLTPGQVATSGVKGICGHRDVEISGLPNTGGLQGHYDPGPHFPWDEFIALVARMLDGPGDDVEDDDVPKPTDVTAVLETKYGLWNLHADGGVFTIRGAFYGSYPGLPSQYHEKPRVFYSIRARRSGKPGYVLTANDGKQYEFGPLARK